ncbi:hypothetical protein HHK36_017126 [Tetracentron sinense]|uniref:Uncharacterized protein n=1 Tax=Tetracentron sinense TaxID=13715 RepID=A0A834Z277_TETSI|nr:hypothetical protein HHK36_017126 [Tetracentron sinense]
MIDLEETLVSTPIIAKSISIPDSVEISSDIVQLGDVPQLALENPALNCFGEVQPGGCGNDNSPPIPELRQLRCSNQPSPLLRVSTSQMDILSPPDSGASGGILLHSLGDRDLNNREEFEQGRKNIVVMMRSPESGCLVQLPVNATQIQRKSQVMLLQMRQEDLSDCVVNHMVGISEDLSLSMEGHEDEARDLFQRIKGGKLMMRVSRDFGDTMQMVAVPLVSADVSFASCRFPNYKIGANNQIVEAKEDPEIPSLKEVVAQETAQLLRQQKRLSVRDLACKFEKGLPADAKLSYEGRLREVASLERHVLLKKLRDALESLRGRVAGRNKDNVEEAISMVEALAVQLTQREGEVIQEKLEVKKLANFLKQASEDAKKLIGEERKFACAEIESARAAVQRVEEALQEQELTCRTSEKQVMDMEHELRALRIQIAEKLMNSVHLLKELEMSKRAEENISRLYELDGSETLGSYLRIKSCTNNIPEILKSTIQWYRVSSEGSERELIAGATKSVYAPEPFDVGRILQADIVSEGQTVTITTVGPIVPGLVLTLDLQHEFYAGLGSYVEALVRKSDAEFNVVVTQMNEQNNASHSNHVFHVGKTRIKLRKGWTTKARESYSTSMQLCGVRSGGNAAAQSLFWQAKKGLSFVLAFQSERHRNAAIMLARKFAFDCNIMLAGLNDRAILRT